MNKRGSICVICSEVLGIVLQFCHMKTQSNYPCMIGNKSRIITHHHRTHPCWLWSSRCWSSVRCNSCLDPRGHWRGWTCPPQWRPGWPPGGWGTGPRCCNEEEILQDTTFYEKEKYSKIYILKNIGCWNPLSLNLPLESCTREWRMRMLNGIVHILCVWLGLMWW